MYTIKLYALRGYRHDHSGHRTYCERSWQTWREAVDRWERDYCAAQEYDQKTSGLQQETFRVLHPTCARKLVEGAEAYARDLGFSPHPDYQRARRIFGDLDPTACPTHYTFGKDGKPFFMSGPYDTPARCRKIIDTLTRRCGPEGFHYTVAIGGPLEEPW